MRIGLVSYEYPPQSGWGGVGTYTFRLAGALGRAGHEVVVLAGPSEEAELQQPNVKIHRIEARYNPPWRWAGLRFLYWNVFSRLMQAAHPLVWHWLRWDMASQQALLDIDQRTPLDVIEAPEHAANGLWVGRMNRWPMVVRIHGPWDLFFGINRTQGTAMNRFMARLERQSTLCAHALTTPSRTMAAFISERWRMQQPPGVLANFMDVPPDPLPLPDGPPRIVCAGRLERFKGQDVLVKAFARMAAAHPTAELWLIGPDKWGGAKSFAQVVECLVPDAQVRRRIVLPGPMHLHAVQAELQKASVVVICSSGFESFSLSTLEAMAAARPIVASRSGAIPELLDNGRCGLLASPGNVAQFAEALDRLLTDRPLVDRLRLAAHARARSEYDTQVVLPRFISTYHQAQDVFRSREIQRIAIPAMA